MIFDTRCLYCGVVIVSEGLTIAVAGGVVLGIFAGLTMLITVFFHRHQYVQTRRPISVYQLIRQNVKLTVLCIIIRFVLLCLCAFSVADRACAISSLALSPRS